MARNKKVVAAIVVCILNITYIQCKVFSKNMDAFRINQEPDIYYRNQRLSDRHARDVTNTNTTTQRTSGHEGLIHSQNSTLFSKSFSIHGPDDNEAFVHWTGQNNDTVFVLTRQHTTQGVFTSCLWRSTNAGDSYSRVTLPDNFLVNHMFSSPVSRNKTILSDVRGGKLYVTEDAGASWSLRQLTFTPYRVLIHPWDEQLLLAYSLQEMKLYVSEDFGATWLLMMDRVTERFFWAVHGVDADVRTVHMELQDPMGPLYYYACLAPNCVKVPVDTSVGTIDFYSLIVENRFIFIQKSVDDNTSLYVSFNRGPFKKALFPPGSNPLDFNILDTSDQQVFMAVDHEEDIANLYLSDSTGQFFIKSVENVVGIRYPGVFHVDLVKVEGLRGVYIVNKFESRRNKGGVFTQQTLITFDKGGSWRQLQAPDDAKQFCEDKQKCFLHLHIGNTNQLFRIPLAVSKPGAPGLILAHGSVGQYLGLDTHVFISRDAGLTWMLAPFTGNHFINILDQGSAISAITAEDYPTNQVHFSCNDGATWVSHNFSQLPMKVDGVINEPGIKTLVSSVFGHVNSSVGWILVKLDFSSVLSHKCVHQDFEMWYPAADIVANDPRCLMGETIMYERRKPMAGCYYGNDYSRPKSVKPCGCQRKDFECDFGFELSAAGDGTCVQSVWFSEDILPTPHCVNDRYNKTSGYRRVASTSCLSSKSDRYSPVETDCPLVAPRGISIVSEKSYIPRGINVTFHLTQEAGSEKETVYTWRFDAGSQPVIVKGLEAAATMTTSFKETGSHVVMVTASNNKGSTQTNETVHVEDQLKGVLVEIPWGARIGIPSYFNVTVLGADNSTKHGTDLHFAWQFESKVTESFRHLTWQNVIQQEFTQPGEYILTLEVFNSVSSIFYRQAVNVYDDVTTVRLHFSSQINEYNSSSLNVRQALAGILCHNLAQILEIRRTRIIMTVQPFMPVVGDVTVLPPNPNSNESETYKIVQMLIEQAKEQYLSFPLFTSDDIVVIMDAGILDLRSGQESATVTPPRLTVTVMVPVNVTRLEERHSLLAVYISVPIILVVIVIAAIVILYYKRKFTAPAKQRYTPIVRAHRTHHDSTCSCGDDDFPINLDDIDDELVPDSDIEPTLMILNEPRNDFTSRLTRNC